MEGGRRTKRQLPILKGLGAQLSLSGRLQEAYELTPGIQIAQCRSYLQTLGPNVGNICVHGSLG